MILSARTAYIASLFCVLFFHQLYIYEKLLTIDECEFICTRSRTVHMLNNIMNMTNTDISCVCVCTYTIYVFVCVSLEDILFDSQYNRFFFCSKWKKKKNECEHIYEWGTYPVCVRSPQHMRGGGGSKSAQKLCCASVALNFSMQWSGHANRDERMLPFNIWQKK